MKYFLLCLASISLFAVAVIPATAKDRIETYNGMKLTLTEKKCTDKTILSMFDQIGLKEEFKDKIKQGKVEAPSTGEKRTLCYVVSPTDKNVILVIDESGDGGQIDLKKTPGL